MHPYAHSHLQRRARLLGFSIAILIAANSVSARYVGGEPPTCETCENSSQGSDADSCSVSEGSQSESAAGADFGSAAGSAAPLSLAYKSYNADGSHAALNTVMGFGWTHSYNVFLFSQRGHIFRFDGDGRVSKYTLGPGGTYAAAPGFFETLVRNPDGSFTLRQKDGTVYTFASVPGAPFQVGGPVYPLQSIVDRNGNMTTLTYVGGLLTQISDTYGKTLHLTYYANKKLKTIVDPAGRVTTLVYNAAGAQLLQIQDPLGQKKLYAYNTQNQIVKKTDRDGRVRTFQYTATKPTGEKDALGASLRKLANPNNWATDPAALAKDLQRVYIPSETRKTDGRGNVWRYQYDENGYITRAIAPDGAATSYTYDPVTLKRSSVTDPNGNVTTFEYDAQGNATKVTDALGFVTTFTYEPTFNMMTSMTDPKGRVTAYEYDSQGNRVKETDPLLQTRFWTYDSHGNVLSATDKRGNTTTYAYDGAGNLASITAPAPLGYVTTMTYDAVGNRLSRTDPNGHVTTYEYDSLDRPIAQTDPLGNVARTAYDKEGSVIQTTDRNGHVATFAYDHRRRLVTHTDALGHPETQAYDGNDNLVSTTDRNGHVTTYQYDVQNRRTQIIDAEGNVAQFQYDPAGNILSTTDANGRVTDYEYDALNRRIQVLDAAGYVTSFEYDTGGSGGGCSTCGATPGASLVTKEIDGNGKVVYFKYDELDRLTQIVRKEGDTADLIDATDAVTRYDYDANGNTLAMTEPNGNAMTYEYDVLDRRTRETNAAGDATEYEYDGDGDGNIVSRTDPNGNVLVFAYDTLERLVQVDDSIGRVASYTYDPVGNRLSKTDGNGNATDYGYDAVDRLVATTDALGESTFTQYDAVGNIVQVIDREGRAATYAYDAINRRVSATDAQPATTLYQYDPVGNLVKMTDPNGHATTYDYDGLNRVIREVYSDPAPNTRAFVYDAENLISRSDQKGQTTNYIYNDLYFLVERDYPVSPDDHFTYDLSGRMLTAERGGWIATFSYDHANRVIQTLQNGEAVSYQYDIPNRTREISYPSGLSITETTDARGRLIDVSDPLSLSPVAEFSYDLANRTLDRIYRNGARTTYSYNDNDWLTQIDHKLGPALIAGFSYGYDHEGNKLSEENLQDPARSAAHQYDAIYRLIDYKSGVLFGSTVPAPATQTAYDLDPVGNWNSKTVDALTQIRTHNATNEIVSIDAVPLSHDDNGNLSEDANFSYAYDEENRLSEIVRKSDSIVVGQYAYDAIGRRVMKTASPAGIPTTTYYFYDGARVVEEQDALGTTEATYTYGVYIDDRLRMTRNGSEFYYHHNSIVSTVAMTDSGGAAVERCRYDVYGAPTIVDGSGAPVPPNAWGTAHSAIGNPYLFTGRRHDEESGLYDYRSRMYDFNLGRFIQRDPIGIRAGPNLYSYVNSRPTYFVDPSGLVQFSIEGAFNDKDWPSGDDLLAAWTDTIEATCEKEKLTVEPSQAHLYYQHVKGLTDNSKNPPAVKKISDSCSTIVFGRSFFWDAGAPGAGEFLGLVAGGGAAGATVGGTVSLGTLAVPAWVVGAAGGAISWVGWWAFNESDMSAGANVTITICCVCCDEKKKNWGPSWWFTPVGFANVQQTGDGYLTGLWKGQVCQNNQFVDKSFRYTTRGNGVAYEGK